MVKAMATMPDGRVLILVGISEGNVEQLKAGRPIYFDPQALRIAPGTTIGAITVFYGADDGALAKTLHDLIGPTTEVIVVPRGDKRPQ